MSGFAALTARELRLALRQGGDFANVVAFFALAAILFPFGIGPEPALLARIASGVLWVTALLAALLSLERLFEPDYQDGSLEQLVLAPMPLELQVLAKCLAHWLVTGLPLTIIAPLIGLFLHLPSADYLPLVLAMALGTPTLSLIGAIGAALALGARRGGERGGGDGFVAPAASAAAGGAARGGIGAGALGSGGEPARRAGIAHGPTHPIAVEPRSCSASPIPPGT